MNLGCRLRITLAAAIAVAASASISLALAPASARANHPLEPDLVTLNLSKSDLFVERVSKHRILLRLTNEVGNQGVGPMEVFPGAENETCAGNTSLEEGRVARQRIFLDADDEDGGFDREVDTDFQVSPAGCMQYHPPHSHWHVLDFAEYSLLDPKTEAPVANGTKAGFCLVDTLTPFPLLPGFPGERHYTFDGCGNDPETPPSLEGISVGYSDVYSSATPGQQINVTGLEAGKYCLVSEADPSDNLAETNDANNAREVLIRLNPDKQKVRRLAGACE
jgi:Lysyl oxidase